MQPATLIYNPSSGSADKHTPERLQKQFAEVGFELRHQPTEREADLENALGGAEGLIVVAGGDGTVRGVITRLLESRTDPPDLCILPLGTANNIASSLELTKDVDALISGLARPRKCGFDVGRLEAPWGTELFLEGAGLGLYADMLAHYDPDEGKSVLRAIGTVTNVLFGYDPRSVSFQVDSGKLKGKLVALELMNTRAIGPRLRLAPDATPYDGLFDVVAVYEPEEVTLLDYARTLFKNDFNDLGNVQLWRTAALEIDWQGEPFHTDAEVRPPNAEDQLDEVKGEALPTSGTIKLSNLAHAVTLWLPEAAS